MVSEQSDAGHGRRAIEAALECSRERKSNVENIHFYINGEPVEVQVKPQHTLLEFSETADCNPKCAATTEIARSTVLFGGQGVNPAWYLPYHRGEQVVAPTDWSEWRTSILFRRHSSNTAPPVRIFTPEGHGGDRIPDGKQQSHRDEIRML
jgi:hypothetical protein